MDKAPRFSEGFLLKIRRCAEGENVLPYCRWNNRRIFILEDAMEATYYTVLSINGDYAYLRSDSGVDNQVAMFLLPEGVDVDCRLLWENFEWTLL